MELAAVSTDFEACNAVSKAEEDSEEVEKEGPQEGSQGRCDPLGRNLGCVLENLWHSFHQIVP